MLNTEETQQSEKKNNQYVTELTTFSSEILHHSCLSGVFIVRSPGRTVSVPTGQQPSCPVPLPANGLTELQFQLNCK